MIYEDPEFRGEVFTTAVLRSYDFTEAHKTIFQSLGEALISSEYVTFYDGKLSENCVFYKAYRGIVGGRCEDFAEECDKVRGLFREVLARVAKDFKPDEDSAAPQDTA